MSKQIEGFLGISEDRKKSRIPAKLDLIQSGTGLVLGLFMWAHMLFVSTILFGEDVYKTVEEKGANLLYFIVKNHSFCVHGVWICFFTQHP